MKFLHVSPQPDFSVGFLLVHFKHTCLYKVCQNSREQREDATEDVFHSGTATELLTQNAHPSVLFNWWYRFIAESINRALYTMKHLDYNDI